MATPYGPISERRTSSLAVASFVAALLAGPAGFVSWGFAGLALGVFALVAGVVARLRTRDPALSGGVLATTAIALGALASLVWGVLVVLLFIPASWD
ncbi:hypothetical protein [Labedella endophytica]|jgi:hypothetical protein|uniref:DUF4190 domain-containing protein n=1 Tax=Labedella endophytica TaxID=1523160 RepID=A0A3S1CSC9_9MICO|nr:hypothetical protein [Labedella endophytica]RUR01279.1 hypothetical protein ELQ94_07145 [Labedella endophytica]